MAGIDIGLPAHTINRVNADHVDAHLVTAATSSTHLRESRKETLLPWATTSCDRSALASKLMIWSDILLLLMTSFDRVSHILNMVKVRSADTVREHPTIMLTCAFKCIPTQL